MKVKWSKPDFGEEEKESAIRSLNNYIGANGPEVKEFEKEFSHAVNTKHAIAVSNGTEFINVGATGTGFSDMDFINMTQQLKPLVTDYEDGTHNVLPRIVLEIKADMITTNEQGGYGLRFPRLVRIRDDKPVSEINTIDDLKEMM